MTARVALALILMVSPLATAALAQEQRPLTLEHLAALDQDADGAVSGAEYQSFMSNAFIALDADDDETLATAEIDTTLNQAQIDELDADGDGMVTRDEFDARTLTDFDAADLDDDGALSSLE